MRALLRCDASAAIGSGHLARCLTLARALLVEGFTVDVATRAPSAHTRAWIEREKCRVVELAEDADDVAATRAAAEGAAVVVIDGYGFGPDFHEALRRADRVVCVIDDLASAPVRGDVVLNGNLYAEGLAYDLTKGATALLGPSYALVRDEFLVAREKRVARPDVPLGRRVLVTMGGADPTRETEKAIAALRALTNVDATIVVGAANPRADVIRAAAAAVERAGRNVEVLVDVRDMGEQMAWCDVALTAAGGTCLELACVGVPAVVIMVADNQRGVAEALASGRLMDVLGTSAGVDPRAIARALAKLLADPRARRAMESAQRACVDGRGKQRAASQLAQWARARTSFRDSRPA